MQDIPTFLAAPARPPLHLRVLTDVEPPLSFRCTQSDWYSLNKAIEQFWWNVRYIRAHAFDGSIDGVIRHEAALSESAEAVVSQLARHGVPEADSRAWLETYREQTDAAERRMLDGEMAEDEETDWRPYDRIAMLYSA